MTRTVGGGLQTHLDGATTSTTTLWRITRQDGAVLRFTSHDQDIVFGGETYGAAVGYQHTDLATGATLAVNSSDVEGILDSAEISEADLRGGRYDYANVLITKVNWNDPDGDGGTILPGRFFGEIEFDEVSGRFTTELRGLSQVFSQTIVEQFGRPCRYNVGDSRCNRDNTVPILPGIIQASTAYAVGDVGRAPRVGASVPPITEDFQDTHYRVTSAGTTGAGINNFPSVLAAAATGPTALSVDDANTFSRPIGSFLDDGWQVDMVFRGAGFANGANNGVFRITAVTASTLDVTPATAVAEAGSGDEVLTHVAYNNGVEFTPENALRVAGEVLEVVSPYQIIVGTPPGGGLLASPVYIENAGFETGTYSGWDLFQGSNAEITTSPVHSGTSAAKPATNWGGPGFDTELRQTRDVSGYATDIDTNSRTVTVAWWQNGTGGSAQRVQGNFDFYDDVGALISTHAGPQQWVGSGVFTQKSEVSVIPVGTRSIRIRIWIGGFVGVITVDDFTITTSLVDPLFPTGEFDYGVLTFDSGLNAGLSESVKTYDGSTKTFTLYLSMPYPIAVGDKIGVHIGCNREPSRCLALGNKINLGGFEFIPGDDEFLSYPDSPY